MNRTKIVICACLLLSGVLTAADQDRPKKIMIASESTKEAFKRKNANAKKQRVRNIVKGKLAAKQRRRLDRAKSRKIINADPTVLTEPDAFSHKRSKQQRRLNKTANKLAPAIQRYSDRVAENRAFSALSCAAAGALAWQAYRVYKQLEAAQALEKQVLADSVMNRYQ